MTDTNRPINIAECGLNLAIWSNETEHGTRFTTELTRSYKDKNDKWQTTHVMREGDQLVAGNLYRRAHNMIQTMKQHQAPNSSAEVERDFQEVSSPEPEGM